MIGTAVRADCHGLAREALNQIETADRHSIVLSR